MDYCDLDCKFASFPKSEAIDGSGSCRTFIALYCSKRKSQSTRTFPVKKTGRGKPEEGLDSKIASRQNGPVQRADPPLRIDCG